MSRDYIGKSDAAVVESGDRIIYYAGENAEQWKIPAPSDELLSLRTEFKAKLAIIKNPSHLPNKHDTLQKNNAKAAYAKGLRVYVQGFIARNPYVTDAERELMGLTVYDVIPTPVADPVGLVSATIKYIHEGALELHIKHVEGTPFDKRANYGVKIKYGVFPIDILQIDDVNQLLESIFTRRKKELITFAKRDSRKGAFFCLRYENSKGKAGQWGPVIAAVIP